MKLVPNWRRVLRHAWSFHLSASIVVLSLLYAADATLPLLNGILPISPTVFALVTFVVSVLATGARFISQEKVTPTNADK